MSLYVLDTDILTLFQEGHTAVTRRILEHRPDEVAVTVLTVEEQLSGWYTQVRKAKRVDRLAWAYGRLTQTIRFLSRLQVFSYTEAAIHRYEELRKARVRIGRTDLRIAAVVLEQRAILVSRNVRDFGKVPGLHLEDWSK